MIDMRNDVSILPSPEMTDEALCRLAQQSNGSAAEDLVKRYTRLVKTCARPYFLAGADAEDLMQEGMLGLLNAVREYDESKGYPEGGIAPGTPWSEVPEDFECPLCGVGKDSFEEA